MMVLLVWLTPPRSNSFKPSHCPPTSLPSPRLQRLSFLTTWRCSSWLWCLLKRAICWSMNQCCTTIRLIGSRLTNTIFLLLIPQRCVLSMLMISADEVASSTAQFFSFGDAEGTVKIYHYDEQQRKMKHQFTYFTKVYSAFLPDLIGETCAWLPCDCCGASSSHARTLFALCSCQL